MGKGKREAQYYGKVGMKVLEEMELEALKKGDKEALEFCKDMRPFMRWSIETGGIEGWLEDGLRTTPSDFMEDDKKTEKPPATGDKKQGQ